MNIIILGAGLMGRAIVFDLINYSNIEKITLIDNNKLNLELAKKLFKNKTHKDP